MTFEIGHLTLQPAAPAPPAPVPALESDAPPAGPGALLDPDVDTRDLIPATPPPEVLAEVDAAWERAAQLAAENRELHFSRDPGSGRTVIEVRSLDGEVLKTIPPAKVLAVMGGEAV